MPHLQPHVRRLPREVIYHIHLCPRVNLLARVWLTPRVLHTRLLPTAHPGCCRRRCWWVLVILLLLVEVLGVTTGGVGVGSGAKCRRSDKVKMKQAERRGAHMLWAGFEVSLTLTAASGAYRWTPSHPLAA